MKEKYLVHSATTVSVVIPMFNSEHTILRALESVASQDNPPTEVICVDDASTDRTVERVRTFSQSVPISVRVVKLNRNLGAAAARNVGLDESVGEFVAFLDADDSWCSGKLSCQLALLRQLDADILGGHSAVFASEPQIANFSDIVPVNRVTLRAAMFMNPYHTSSVIMRRDETQRFPVGLLAEDFAMWLQTLAQDRRAYSHSQPLSYMYKRAFGDRGLSSAMLRMQRGELRALWGVRSAAGIGVTLAAIVFSTAKYLRRCLVISLRASRDEKNPS